MRIELVSLFMIPLTLGCGGEEEEKAAAGGYDMRVEAANRVIAPTVPITTSTGFLIATG